MEAVLLLKQVNPPIYTVREVAGTGPKHALVLTIKASMRGGHHYVVHSQLDSSRLFLVADAGVCLRIVVSLGELRHNGLDSRLVELFILFHEPLPVLQVID